MQKIRRAILPYLLRRALVNQLYLWKVLRYASASSPPIASDHDPQIISQPLDDRLRDLYFTNWLINQLG
jgi:hypothetical protein